MAVFEGIPKETLVYLKSLSENNNKAWFETNRDDYEAFYMAPARQLVVALGDRLKSLDPEISCIPMVNKSIFRINNDMRFAKTPYKDHIDLRFYHGEDRKAGYSSFFFRLMANEICIGAGVYRFEKTDLATFRASVVKEIPQQRLSKIVRSLTSDNYDLPEKHYKTIPKGFSEIQANEFLKYSAFHASRTFAIPGVVHSPEFINWCIRYYTELEPLHQWLVAYAHGG